MPVFHTKTIESILEPVAQQVSVNRCQQSQMPLEVVDCRHRISKTQCPNSFLSLSLATASMQIKDVYMHVNITSRQSAFSFLVICHFQ